MSSLKFLRNVELKPEEILLVESDINYSQIFLSNGRKIIIAKTLKQISEIVKNSPFVRINRQVLINIGHVKNYEMETSPQNVTLSNGRKIDFSRRRSEAAKTLIEKFITIK